MTYDFVMGGAEWLGTEIDVSGRGSLWMDPVQPFTMLYGRNGAGKSTILDALKALAKGEVLGGIAARAYFRLVPNSPIDLERLFFRSVAGSLRMIKGRSYEEFWVGREPDARLRGLFRQSSTLELSPDERSLVRKAFATVMPDMASLLGVDPIDAAGFADELTEAWSTAVANAPFGRPFWYLGAAVAAAGEALFRRAESFDKFEETADLFGFSLAEFGLQRGSWGQTTWDAKQHDELWPSMCARWAVEALDSFHDIVATNTDFNEVETDRPLIELLPAEWMKRVGQTMRAVCHCGVVEISATGSSEQGTWSLRPALDLQPDSWRASLGSFDSDDARWLGRALADPETADSGEQMYALQLWQDIEARSLVEVSNDHSRRYMALPIGREIPISIFPFDLVDLDEQFDPEAAVCRSLTDEFGDETVLFGENGVEVELSALEHARQRVEAAGALLSRLDLGVKALRLCVEPSLGTWMSGQPLTLEALDEISGRWVSAGSLSGAQRQWLRRALVLEANSVLRRPKLVVCDEPESGIHERAVVAVFDFLSQIDGCSLVATHSPRALTNPRATVLHVARGADGSIEAFPPMLGGDLVEAAERFGVMPADLLGMKRVMIVVEGSHDRLIIEHLLQLSTRDGLADRCLIAEARGSKNVATVADSVILSQFTDMHVFVICDNTRAEVINQFIDGTIKAISGGGSAVAAANRDEIQHFRNNAHDEERWLLDLLHRATVQGILHRLRVGGISTPDITDLLPSEAFELKQDWPELRKERAEAIKGVKSPPNFKAWLKAEKSVSISIPSITRVLASQRVLHDELLALLAEIEILVDVAAL